MIEGFIAVRQGKDIRLLERYVGDSSQVGPALRFGDRVCGDVNGRESCRGAPLGQCDRLGTDAAAGLEHDASLWVRGVEVQEVDQRSGLVLQALVLSRVIA